LHQLWEPQGVATAIGIEVFFSRAGVGHAGFENNVIVTATGSDAAQATPQEHRASQTRL
jgi:hypothetical protein